MKPVILVVAFNRPKELANLLKSLASANYDEIDNVDLVISVDGGGDLEVINVAQEFSWDMGSKKVITLGNNIGLKRNIIESSSVVNEYDSIVVLEDDLIVGRNFYQFASIALDYYKKDKRIAQISLYNPRYNETANMPFEPIKDEYDSFFIQLSSSWGQAYTKEQWEQFLSYYKENNSFDSSEIPPNVRIWPESSWKKEHIGYLVKKNLYVVYPYVSYTTNVGSIGQNHVSESNLYQSTVNVYSNIKSIRLADFDKSVIKYDSYLELLGSSFIKLTNLVVTNPIIDLNGTKDVNEMSSIRTLVSIKSIKSIKSGYSLKLSPITENFRIGFLGDFFHIGKVSDFENSVPEYKKDFLIRFYNEAGYILGMLTASKRKREPSIVKIVKYIPRKVKTYFENKKNSSNY
jgi:hypothetical protein